MNQLQNQVSPYLLQHKNNPVAWFPWSEIALEKARLEDKPIILSIGYAACHWCHVMEHESFENQEVADLMNAHFVCIKVDREERPDIDLIYMDAIHAMGLQGGWPLNVFLMPDQKPFYGGTYFPKNNWIQIINSIQKAFLDHRSELQQSADGFASNLNANSVGLYPLDLNELSAIIPLSIDKIEKGLDPIFGGTSKAPKFPIPSLSLYLESLPKKLFNSGQIPILADLQLTKMAQGGIFDQVGGGFSRYSVDSEWFCPHFEKMLYDNAQLIRTYSLAYGRTNNPLYKEVVMQTIEFLNRELLADNGLFFASIDADSEGVEGLYYVWTFEELNRLLPFDVHRPFYQAYSLNRIGNWEHGYNILFKNNPVLNETFREELTILNTARNSRIRPSTDNKQLLAWNALVSLGLFEAGIIFNNSDLIRMANDHLNSMSKRFLTSDFKLVLHQISYSGKPIAAFLDDLSAFGLALIKGFRTSGDTKHIKVVSVIIDVIEHHHLEQNSYFNFHSNLNDALIAPKFEVVDSVCPSANSMVCELFLWYGIINNEPKYTIKGKNMLSGIIEQAQANPIYFANWLRIYSEWIENPKAILKFNPNQIDESLLVDLQVNRISVADLASVFMVCIGDHCLKPCADLETLKDQLASI